MLKNINANMKEEKGLGIIGIIILVALIIGLAFAIAKYFENNDKKAKEDTIKSNMMLIQAACKGQNDNKKLDGNTVLYGTSLDKYADEYVANSNELVATNEIMQTNEIQQSETQLDNNTQTNSTNLKTADGKIYDEKIIEFKKHNLISADQYGMYYVLSNDDLKDLKLDVQNETDGYYLVNYDENEVIYTNGINGKYKLSEILVDDGLEDANEVNEIQK